MKTIWIIRCVQTGALQPFYGTYEQACKKVEIQAEDTGFTYVIA